MHTEQFDEAVAGFDHAETTLHSGCRWRMADGWLYGVDLSSLVRWRWSRSARASKNDMVRCRLCRLLDESGSFHLKTQGFATEGVDVRGHHFSELRLRRYRDLLAVCDRHSDELGKDLFRP